MSATSGSFVQEPKSQECMSIGAMKIEPDHQLENETIGRHEIGRRNSDMSSMKDVSVADTDAASNSEDNFSTEGCIRQKILQKITEEGQAKVTKLLNDIKSLNDVEMISLYLSLPLGSESSDPSNSGNASLGSNNSLHLSNQLEQSQAYTWIMSHLEEESSTCLRKDEVYDDYRSYCDNHSMKCLNTADFGKVMKRAFPKVKPRRLGQRGQSKYCYGGLRKRVEVQPPHLPDINPDVVDNGSRGADGRETSSEQSIPPGESMLSECIALVLEWVEKLLGRQFVTLRQLAEYLVLNMYVNSRSCAAFALVADVHNRQGQQGTSTSKLSGSPRIVPELRRRTSQKDGDGASRHPSPRTEVGQHIKASGSSSDGSTPPIPVQRPSSQSHFSGVYGETSTPPGPPGTHGVRRLVTSPAVQPVHQQHHQHSVPPTVKPNLLELPTNIKDMFHPSSQQQSQTQLPHNTSQSFQQSAPMRAYPRSGTPLTHSTGPVANPQHQYSHNVAATNIYASQPPDAHSYQPHNSSTCRNYPPVSDGYRPPPPLQYGGGSYTPVHRGKRPYEVSNQEYYSPYYPYPSGNVANADYTTSPKRTRYASLSEAAGDSTAYYHHRHQQQQPPPPPPQQQQQAPPQPQPAPYVMGTQYPQQQHHLPSTDHYGNLGMLSPGGSSRSRHHIAAAPSTAASVHSSRYSLPRVGPSPGPPAGSAPPPQQQQMTSRSQANLRPVPALPRVGRSPSPLRFTSGPPSAPGVRRPSPLRSTVPAPSPGLTQNCSPMLMESPESGSSIHLPPLCNVGLARSPGSPFRSLPKKTPSRTSVAEYRARPASHDSEFDFPDGAPSSSIQSDTPEESKVTSTVVMPCDRIVGLAPVTNPAAKDSASSSLCGFGDDTRNSDLHTPTPPTAVEYPYVDPRTQAPQRETSGLSPPSALL